MRRKVSCIADIRRLSCGVFVTGVDPTFTSFVLNSLRSSRYSVCAGEPAAAFRCALSGDIALLITDVVLPETSGLELAAQLREMLPNLKIIYISRETDPVMVRGRIDAGSDFVILPVNTTLLLRKVSGLLDQDWSSPSETRRPRARSSGRAM